jgi:hypothetical protein
MNNYNKKNKFPYCWNATDEEIIRKYPCDYYLPNPDNEYIRVISIQTNPKILFRWLCQLKEAPYSYDMIDNFGKRSPRYLIPGSEKLSIGQTIMDMFKIVDFQYNKHITMKIDGRIPKLIFGECVVSYLIQSNNKGCRLIVKARTNHSKNIFFFWIPWILPWGDLLMLRKQFITFKQITENKALNNFRRKKI